MNQQVDEQSVLVVDEMRDLISRLVKIRAYAQDETQPSPDTDDYAVAGISDVTSLNVDQLNQVINEQGTLTVNAMRQHVSDLNQIQAYALNGNQTSPELSNYINLGIANVTSLNLNEVNQLINEDQITSIDAIRTIVFGANRIQTFANDSDASAPFEADYLDFGIADINALNLDEVNQQVSEQSLTDVNSIRNLVTRMNRVQSYAQNSAAQTPEVTDYLDVGVAGVDVSNLDDINQQVNEQSLLQVDAMRELVSSLTLIRTHGQTDVPPLPSLEDYLRVGVNGMDEADLAQMNQQIREQDVLAVDEMRRLLSNYNQIQNFALNANETSPEVSHFDALNVSGVTADNLTEVNQLVNEQALVAVDEMRVMVTRVNRLRDFAQNDQATTPIPEDYAISGVMDVDDNNLDEINQQLNEQQILTIDAMRNLVTNVNHLRRFALDDSLDTPELSTYQVSGVDAIDADNLSQMNQVMVEQGLQRIDNMRAVVASLNLIQGIAQDANAAQPELLDFAQVGIANVTNLNHPEINQQVSEQGLMTVDAIRGLVSAIDQVQQFGLSMSEDAPQPADYQTAGVSNVNTFNLDEINQQVRVQGLSEVDDIRALTRDLNVIFAYAQDENATLPEETHYQIAGITGLNAANLDAINQQVREQSLVTVQDIDEVIVSLDVVRNFALNDNAAQPQLTDYQRLAANNISQNNLMQINQIVREQDLQAVDDVKAALNAVEKMQSYALNGERSAPNLTDFNLMGITGVSTENINELNDQMQAQNIENIDAARTLVSSINTIKNFVFTQGLNSALPVAEPQVSDFETAGIRVVTEDNIEQIRLEIAEKSLDDMADIRTLVTSYNRIEHLFGQSELGDQILNPSRADFDTLAVTGVNEANIADINQQIGAMILSSREDIQTFVDCFNRIRDFSAAPDVSPLEGTPDDAELNNSAEIYPPIYENAPQISDYVCIGIEARLKIPLRKLIML